MNFNRRQREAVRLHVIAGPGAGTVEAIRASDFRSGGYFRGAMARLLDVDDGIDQDALVATLYDDDEYDDLLAQAGHRRSSKRARTSEATLQGLPEVTAGRSREGEDCAVCLQAFCADEKLRAMPCSHAFHQHCISEWLCRNAVCPPCRHQLPPADADEQIAI
ncbi:hypothetical protein GQ55_3G081700 [Panicum hallii var. hallii]|uniref:RING-type domain-containing protein n=1 Tax=Panicum hallii var. hallii TaxID=1504633 RepID=A0A2T7E6Z6_9POAL|nr:hypothetical protein GQ55_3G081700 [Panicum hallii var. hallii]